MKKQVFKKIQAVAVLSTVAYSTLFTSAFAATTINNSALNGGMKISAPATLALGTGTEVKGDVLVEKELTVTGDSVVLNSALQYAAVKLAPENAGTSINLGGAKVGTLTITNNNVQAVQGVHPSSTVVLAPGVTNAPRITDSNGNTVTPITTSDKLSVNQITVVNTADEDSVTVSGVTSGDVIRVYAEASGTNAPIGKEIASSSTVKVVIFNKLDPKGGKVYVSRQQSGKAESERTAVEYGAETANQSTSTTPDTALITVTTGDTVEVTSDDTVVFTSADTVKVTGLTSGDTITVYDAESGGNKLGDAKADGTGKAVVILPNGTIAYNKIWVTRTESGKKESARVEKVVY